MTYWLLDADGKLMGWVSEREIKDLLAKRLVRYSHRSHTGVFYTAEAPIPS
jgi:hypothetical protein